MHGHRPRRRPQRFPCVQAIGHIFEGIYFKLGRWVAMAEISPPYRFDTPTVKIMTQSKMSKILTHACVQATGHSSFLIFFIFSMCINMVEVSPPYLFGSPVVNIQ